MNYLNLVINKQKVEYLKLSNAYLFAFQCMSEQNTIPDYCL